MGPKMKCTLIQIYYEGSFIFHKTSAYNFDFKKIDEGLLCSRNAPELRLEGLIDDMHQASSFLLLDTVQFAWPQTCRCSQCGGFARVPSCPCRIRAI
jgi:hypothetical protein